MKKKTIIFSLLALLFLLSAFNGFAEGLISGSIACLVICGILAFLAFRSAKSTPNNTIETNTTKILNVAPVPDNSAQRQNEYIFAPIRIAGVTYNNDDGVSRQLILRKLHFHDSPFDKYIDITIKQYEFEGQLAYGVYVNDVQIGNIPADLVPFLQENIGRIESISYIDVYGGGRNKDGKPISYGCRITLRFLKDNPPTNIPDALKIND